MCTLIANIFPNLSLIQANCTHAVASRPKVEPCQILCPSKISSVDKNRRLPLQLSDCVGNTELGRDAQAHVHMIGECMTLDQFKPELLTQLSKYSADLFPQSSKNRLLSILGDEHDMVPAVPTDVSLAFPFSHRLSSSMPRRAWVGEPVFSSFGNPGLNLFGSHRQRRWFNCCNYFKSSMTRLSPSWLTADA